MTNLARLIRQDELPEDLRSAAYDIAIKIHHTLDPLYVFPQRVKELENMPSQ